MKTTRKIARALALPVLGLLLLLTCLACPGGGAVLATATLTSFSVKMQINWQYDLASTGLTNPNTNTNGFNVNLSTVNGTGAAGTANLIYAVQITIAGGGNTTINVNSSPVSDWFGATIVMARVKFFFINLTTATSASSIAVGNAAAPIVNWISAPTSTIAINNGGVWLQGDTGATGYAVTTTTHDVLKVLNNDGSNTATLNLVLVGSTA